MVDEARLRTLLDRLRDLEHELARLRSLGREPVLADTDRLNSVKYTFVIAAEVAIDAGQHVIAAGQHVIDAEGSPAAATFADVFQRLSDAGWLPEDLAESLGNLARFRNLLVHGYAEVDDNRVVEILHGPHLGDLGALRQQLSRAVGG